VKFKIDENLPIEIADDLRALDYDAVTVFDQAMVGADDDQLLRKGGARRARFFNDG
jgi:hypothetical protein